MKTLNDVYKKLLKEYPDWNIEYKQDNIILEKDLFYINANEDMVSIHKKYNIFCKSDTKSGQLFTLFLYCWCILVIKVY